MKVEITIRRRRSDGWFGVECPNCGASILDRTTIKVKQAVQQHNKQYSHGWSKIKFSTGE